MSTPNRASELPVSIPPVARSRPVAGVAWVCWRASAVGFAMALLALARFAWQWRPTTWLEAVFVCFAWFDQALMITLPLFAFAALTEYIERARPRGRRFRIWMAVAFSVLATLIASIVLADVKIYALYGFHINGFVWNLITTRGGLASLEASSATWITVSLMISAIFGAILGLVFWLNRRLQWAGAPTRRRTRWAFVFAALAVILLDKGLYGYADLSGNGIVLRASGMFPFYQPVTFRSAAKRMGIETAPSLIAAVSQRGRLAYPKHAIHIAPVGDKPPPNILWLAVESMRWDLLTPETMPHLWAFAADNLRFTHHFSGGNRTRMGMFTMFYSLYGPYWSHVLEEQRNPVFFDVLDRLDYDIDVFTSAKFSYPEFDRTIFFSVPAGRRHEYSQDPVFWHRDVHNVDAIIASLRQRDARRPFMRFLFFESTHAPYQFPAADAIAKPFGTVANYALMNPQRDIALMWNRYVNAAHFVDSQIGRLIDYLDTAGLLQNTIVVVTGDHGEEFLEHGHWGHGSAFVDQQMRVPLVMRVPGQRPRVIDTVTSHVDIVPSLLPALGVTNPPSDYAQGADVVRGVPRRDYIIAAKWSGFAYIDPQYIATIPLSGGFDTDVRRHGDDTPVPALPFLQSHGDRLAEVMAQMSRFLTRH